MSSFRAFHNPRGKHASVYSGLVALLAIALVSLLNHASAADAKACEISETNHARELHDVLSLRAIETIKLILAPNWKTNERLGQLVAPEAVITVGGGDVSGIPRGLGLEGVRALADEMQADHYSFLGWDYMDGPANACAEHKVTVEFTNTPDKGRETVEFTFVNGRLVGAKGFHRSFEAGSLP